MYDDRVNNKLDNKIFEMLRKRIISQINILDKKLDDIVIDDQELKNVLDISKSRVLISKLIDKITISKNKGIGYILITLVKNYILSIVK